MNNVFLSNIQRASASGSISGIRNNILAYQMSEPETISTNTSDKVTISKAAFNADTNWQAIAKKYDVTNISTADRVKMTEELHEDQLISSDVMIFLMAPLSINEDVNQKTDYLGIIRESFKIDFSMEGNQSQLELKKKRLEILEHLNALRSS